MKVVIRADASSHIGSGHIMRCLTIATSLQKLGFTVTFVCAEFTGNLVSFIKTKGFEVLVLPVCARLRSLQSTPEYRWQTEHQLRDAEQLVQYFRSNAPELILVDHYGLDRQWHRCVRALDCKIVVIDDLVNRPLDCDILINQNLVDMAQLPYKSLVTNENCLFLTGPEFALLRSEVYELAHQERIVDSDNKQICVFLGYIDPDNVTQKVIAGLLSLEPTVSIHLVLNPLHPDYKALLNQTSGHNNITTYTRFVELIGLFKKCDLVVGAGGGASWERCCLGIPSIQVALTDNQVSVCEALARRNAITYIGQGHEITIEQVHDAAFELLHNRPRFELIADSARQLVDGLGVNRIIAEVCGHKSKCGAAVFLRTLTKSDANMVYGWQHEPNMRKHCRIDAPPDKKEHNKWIDNRVEDSTSLTEIIVHGDVPVGMIRLDWAADMQAMEVSILLTTASRGYGVAKIALSLLIARYANTPIVAYISSENTTSQHLFRNIGFVRSQQDNWWFLSRD